MNLSSGKRTAALTSRSTLCTLAILSRRSLSTASKKGEESSPQRDLFPEQGPKPGASRKHRGALELDCELRGVLFNVCTLDLSFFFLILRSQGLVSPLFTGK